MPTDKLLITALHLNVLIGAYPEERLQPQPLILDLELTTDMRPAGKSDRLEDAINYDALLRRVEAWAVATNFQLLEALAEHLCQLLLKTFPISSVRLRLTKPNVVSLAERVGIEIERFWSADGSSTI